MTSNEVYPIADVLVLVRHEILGEKEWTESTPRTANMATTFVEAGEIFMVSIVGEID